MMSKNVFSKAEWIWAKDSLDRDDYASFEVSFCASDKTILRIACDSIYAVYLNGVFLKSMQCSDYPHYRFYDEIALPCKASKNKLRIDVWHIGIPTSNYYPDVHGLIFEVAEEDRIILTSNESTPSRVMNEFHNGLNKKITTQLGLSFEYDANSKPRAYADSVLVNKRKDAFHPRDIHEIVLQDRRPVSYARLEHSLLVDMGKETVGYLDLALVSPKKQTMTFAFGEHIKDGHVRRIINERDFSFVYIAKEGENVFLNPLRRLAGRYIEIFYEDEPEIQYIGFRPVSYQHEIIEKEIDDPLLKKIYDTCRYTLECCMHEHYEDCPWREQALYNLDSRNQMLCGYYAFKGHEYQRHNLLLMAQDELNNGLLSLCFPMKSDGLAIPMFSLCYVIQVYEYIRYTKDEEILKGVGRVLDTIMDTFSSKIDVNGLIPYFPKPLWNFYEWTKGSANDDVFSLETPAVKDQYDLIINAMYAYVVPMYNELMGKHLETSKAVAAIQKCFYMEDSHLYKMNTKTDEASQFGNALALLIGLGDIMTLEKLVTSEGMVPASLSTRGFVYDAMLAKDKGLLGYIIADIKSRYGKMLNEGATTVYETELGSEDFGGAGSMCHGWSALPIYYINLYLGK